MKNGDSTFTGDPVENEAKAQEPPAPIADPISVFRIIDSLLGINQVCEEAVLQLRLSHLYQLRRDRKSLVEKLSLILLAAVTIIPTLDHLFPHTDLKWPWIGAALIFPVVLLFLEWDNLFARGKEFRSVRKFEELVKKDQLTSVRDYIYSYVTRHDMAYHAHDNSTGTTRKSLRIILDSYEAEFRIMRSRLTKLKDEQELGQKEYDELIEYIEVCEQRYATIPKANVGETEGNTDEHRHKNRRGLQDTLG